jgi:hypothetical protein
LFAPFRLAPGELRFAITDDHDFVAGVEGVANQVFVATMERRELADDQAALKAFAHGMFSRNCSLK